MTENKVVINRLFQLVDMKCPSAVFEEIKYNFIQFYPITGFQEVREMFQKYLNIYAEKPGNEAALSLPHRHVTHGTDTALAFSRLVDGCNLSGKILDENSVRTGLIVSFFHNVCESEYQPADCSGGTSVDFMKAVLGEAGFPPERGELAGKMVECTDFESDISHIQFKSEEEKEIVYMVGTANIIGQMSSRNYLESLFALYNNVKEAGIINADSVIFIMKKTIDFYRNNAKRRLNEEFHGVHNYAKAHFAARYGIESNFYMEGIERQLEYLEKILDEYPGVYWEKLRRK